MGSLSKVHHRRWTSQLLSLVDLCCLWGTCVSAHSIPPTEAFWWVFSYIEMVEASKSEHLTLFFWAAEGSERWVHSTFMCILYIFVWGIASFMIQFMLHIVQAIGLADSSSWGIHPKCGVRPSGVCAETSRRIPMYRHGRIMHLKTYITWTWGPRLCGACQRLSPLDRFLGLPCLVRYFLKHAVEMLNRIDWIDVRLGVYSTPFRFHLLLKTGTNLIGSRDRVIIGDVNWQGNLQKMQAERSQVQEWLEETKTDLMEPWHENLWDLGTPSPGVHPNPWDSATGFIEPWFFYILRGCAPPEHPGAIVHLYIFVM